MKAALLALAALLGSAALGGCDGVREIEGAATACRQVDLIDADSGAFVRGAEDLAADPATGRLYIAALDRWALEDAIDRDAAALPQGALYVVAAADVAAAETPLRVQNASRDFTVGHAFHPHGLDVRRQGGDITLAVVNRRFRRGGTGEWRSEPVIETFTATDGSLAHRRTLDHDSVCRPNDVAILADGRLAVSNERGCGGLPGWLEGVLGLARGSIVALAPADGGTLEARTLADGIGFANGVVAGPRGRLSVAASRDKSILVYDLTGDGADMPLNPVARLPLDGGPDNLTRTHDGWRLAAVHPSLISLALYRYRWFGWEHAASRVVAVSPDGDIVLLFDDPDGRVISAATAAFVLGDHLFIGSVTDRGLAVCHLPPGTSTREPETAS